MPFDYKKEYKELYSPKMTPSIITVPKMQFVAVRGMGDPNEKEGEYARALQLLYGISYTIKMSHRSKNPADHIEGYKEYVVPPLEGLWWMEDGKGGYGMDYSRKHDFQWISMIRLPEFVTAESFSYAANSFATKHPEAKTENAFLFDYDEALVAQVLHKGPYDDEPATVSKLDSYAQEQGYRVDFGDNRHHHEIYLSDPRRAKPENLRTIIRHPVTLASH
jgi:Uncharacterized conserved protein